MLEAAANRLNGLEWRTGRALVYRFAAESGFRAGEIQQMRVTSFALDGDLDRSGLAGKDTTKNGKPRTVERPDTRRPAPRPFRQQDANGRGVQLPDSTHTPR